MRGANSALNLFIHISKMLWLLFSNHILIINILCFKAHLKTIYCDPSVDKSNKK